MMAAPSLAADIAHIKQSEEGTSSVWEDGQVGDFTLIETPAVAKDGILIWSDTHSEPLTIGAAGKDIKLTGKNSVTTDLGAPGAFVLSIGQNVSLAAGALDLTVDNTVNNGVFVGFQNVRNVTADSLTVNFGQTDAHAGGTYTLIKATSADSSSDITVKGDINVKTKGLGLFDLVSGSTATLKSETGGITIEDGLVSSRSVYLRAGSTLNLEAEKDIVIRSSLNGVLLAEENLFGTSGTVNLTSHQGNIDFSLSGTCPGSTNVNVLVLGTIGVSSVTDRVFGTIQAKNIRLIGEIEGGQYSTGLFVRPEVGEVKLVADETVLVQVHSSGTRSPNGIELYGEKASIEAKKLNVNVEHDTDVFSTDMPSGILLEKVNAIINADADVHSKRASTGPISSTSYSNAVAFSGTASASIDFQRNAVLTADYAVNDESTGSTVSNVLKKTGTDDLVLNGRVNFGNANSLLDVQDNCGVILNGTDDTFTDVIAKYSGAQGTRLVKNSVSDLKLGFANNTLAGDLEINTGKVILTTDAEFSGNVTVDGSALTVNAAEGVLSGTGTLSFAEGSKVVVKNVAATAESDFYTLTSGFSAVSGLDNISSNNRLQKVILLAPTDDQYRFTVATQSASEVFGDEISNSELIDQISGSGSDTEIGQIIETIASQDPAGVTNEEIAHQLDSVFDFSKLSGASYGALYAAGLASDAITEHVRSEKAARNTGLWVDVMGGHNRIKELGTSGHHYGLKTDAYGVTFGADMSVYEGLNLGAAMTFVKNDIESTGSYQKTENKQKTYGVRVYGKQTLGEKASLIGQIGYAYADNDITQGLPAGLGVLKGDPKGSVVSAEVGLELPLMTGSWEVVQHTGVKYNYVKTDSFTATRNGAAVYRAEKQENHVVQVPIGVRIGKTIEAQGWTVKPEADISIVPALGGNTLKTKIRVGDVSAMTTKTDLISETYAAGMIGVEAEKGPHAVGLKYRFAAGDSDMQDHSVRVQYRYSF